jgi:hypothetical protein
VDENEIAVVVAMEGSGRGEGRRPINESIEVSIKESLF